MIRRIVIFCALCASAVTAQTDRAMMEVHFVRPGIISELTIQEASGFCPAGVNSGLVAYTGWYTATGGAAQIAQTGFALTIQTGRSFTISGWVRTSATNEVSLMGGNMGAPGALIDLLPYSSAATGVQFAVRDDDSTVSDFASSSFDVRDGQWHMLTGVFDAPAALLSLYVDGLLRSTASITVNSSATKTFSTPLGLLALSRPSSGPLRTIRGDGRDFDYFPKALSATEVGELFSARK